MILLLAACAAMAQSPTDGAEPDVQQVPQKDLGDYVNDLRGDDPEDRTWAARVLRTRTLAAARAASRGEPGSLAREEARAALLEIDARVPEACVAALATPAAAPPCAELLAALARTEALPAVRAAAAREERTGRRRRLDAAVTALEAFAPAAAPPPPTPAAPPTP